MNQNTDILHEARKLRLLAAALELQHFASTATNIVPIPGTDRVIAIGTPAQVRALLADDDADAKDAARYRLLRDAEKVPPAVWDALETGEGLDHAMDCFVTDLAPIPFCEPCQAGRYGECQYAIPCTLPAAAAHQVDSEGGLHD